MVETTRKKSPSKASTTRKKRGEMALVLGQIVLYKGEEVEIIGIEGDLCKIFMKKIINNDITEIPDSELGMITNKNPKKKKRAGRDMLSLPVQEINNSLNEYDIKKYFFKMFREGQTTVDIFTTDEIKKRDLEMKKKKKSYLLSISKLDNEEAKELGELKEIIVEDDDQSYKLNNFVHMSFERQGRLVERIFGEKKEEITKSFLIEDNYWKYKYHNEAYNFDLIENCNSPSEDNIPCPELFSEIDRKKDDNNDRVFGKKMIHLEKKNYKNVKDSFQLYICIQVPRRELDTHIFKTECSKLRFTGSSFINAVLNSLFMPLSIRKYLYSLIRKAPEDGFLTQTQLEEQPPSIESYSLEKVEKHFKSLVRLLENEKIESPHSLVDTLELQVKQNYMTIMSKYDYDEQEHLYDVSNPLSDPSSDDTFLALLEILKTFVGLIYEIQGEESTNYLNFVSIANGENVVIKNNELKKIDELYVRKLDPSSKKNHSHILIKRIVEQEKVNFKKIYIDRVEYHFMSMVITFPINDGTKVIKYSLTGYVCNEKHYVYDSNNYIDQIDFTSKNFEMILKRKVANRLNVNETDVGGMTYEYLVYVIHQNEDTKSHEPSEKKEDASMKRDSSYVIEQDKEAKKIHDKIRSNDNISIKDGIFLSLYEKYFPSEKFGSINQENILFRQEIIEEGRKADAMHNKVEEEQEEDKKVRETILKKGKEFLKIQRQNVGSTEKEEKKEEEEKKETIPKINVRDLKINESMFINIFKPPSYSIIYPLPLKVNISDLDLSVVSKSIESNDGWKLLHVPPGTNFYRGLSDLNDERNIKLEDNNGESENFIYFGNLDVAAMYAFQRKSYTWGIGRIVCVKSTKDMYFLDFSQVSNFDKIYKLTKNNSRIQYLFFKCFNYIQGNTNLKRTSTLEADYPLSELLCKLLSTLTIKIGKENININGFGYNNITDFHMEYIVCRGNITKYMEPSDLEYWYFNFYRYTGGSSVIFETKRQMHQPLPEFILTNNIIYTETLPSFPEKPLLQIEKEYTEYDEFLQKISSGWRSLFLQEPIYYAFRIYCYNHILDENKRQKFLDDLGNARELFLKKGHGNNSSPQKTRRITPSPSKRLSRKKSPDQTESENYLNKISNTKKEEIKDLDTLFSKLLFLNYGNEKKAILKFNLSSSGYSASYEAYVGVFLNKLNKQFPFFVETYGCLEGPLPVEQKNEYPKIFPSYMKLLEPIPLKYEDLKPFHSLKDSQLNAQYGILMEFINGESLCDFIKQDEIWILLFQVYSVLDYLKGDFVHGDLYCRNVMVVPVVEDPKSQEVKFVYHYPGGRVFTFYSSYIVKMIDFGSSQFYDRDVEEEAPSYIPYRNRNMYHDLLLIIEVLKTRHEEYSEFYKVINKNIDEIKLAQRVQLNNNILKELFHFPYKDFDKINQKNRQIVDLKKEIKSFRILNIKEKEDITEVFEFLNSKIKANSKQSGKKVVVGTMEIWMDGSNQLMERSPGDINSSTEENDDTGSLFPLGLFMAATNEQEPPTQNVRKTNAGPTQKKPKSINLDGTNADPNVQNSNNTNDATINQEPPTQNGQKTDPGPKLESLEIKKNSHSGKVKNQCSIQ